jgi:hypothetical protein
MLIIYEIILDFLLILHKLSINISPHKLSSVGRDITYIMQKNSSFTTAPHNFRLAPPLISCQCNIN